MPDGGDENADNGPDTFHREQEHNSEASDEGFGDDFDDFEAGDEAEDFGDFGDGFEQPSAEPEPPRPEIPSIAKAHYVSSSNNKILSSIWNTTANSALFSFKHILSNGSKLTSYPSTSLV